MDLKTDTKDLFRDIALLENLPTLPSFALELIARWHDPDLSIRTVTDFLTHDPSMSAKVLQVANARYPDGRGRITSLKHAAALLGLNNLRCLTLSVTVFDVFLDSKPEWAETFDVEEFWRHCLAVAVTAEMLADRLGHQAPEEAFLSGLLHDIGKIGLLAVIPRKYVEIIQQARTGNQNLSECEKESLSVTHAEIGKWICEHWGLPDIFRKAVWLHHQPLGNAPRHDSGLEDILHLSDLLVRRSRIGYGGNSFLPVDDAWINQQCGFANGDLDKFTEELLTRVQRVGEEFKLQTPTMQLYFKAIQDANTLLAQKGMETEREFEVIKDRYNLLQVMNEIAKLPFQKDLELHLFGEALELVRRYLKLPWMVVITYDAAKPAVEGVYYSSSLGSTQTFYRVLNEGDVEPGEFNTGHLLTKLQDIVLSNGKRVNLQQETLQVFSNGSLIAHPLEVDAECRGQCLVDTASIKNKEKSVKEALETLVDASVLAYQRARLYRRLQLECETSAEATRREYETQQQMFHIERLASVGRLAAGAAHEINNPLAVISGKAQLLLAKEEDDRRRKSLGDIVDQTMRISKIISDLMGFARPAEPTIAPYTLPSLIENSLQIASHRLRYNQVQIENNLADDLPVLHVDGRQIEQVLINLVVNAMQAMGGEGLLKIEAYYKEDRDMAVIKLTDSGQGIPAENLERVFDPFFTTKDEGEGTGLGLAVSYRIIESHGGHLSVQSQVGKGTTFTIQLPCGQGIDKNILDLSGQRPKARKKSLKKRILLVDDEEQLSNLIHDFLNDAGYLVDQASDGVEAIKYLQTNLYDGIILDIRMPRKNGLEVLEDVRRTLPSMPTLVITGLASNEEIDQAEFLGADAILRKPFQLDSLLQAVEEVVHHRGSSHGSGK